MTWVFQAKNAFFIWNFDFAKGNLMFLLRNSVFERKIKLFASDLWLLGNFTDKTRGFLSKFRIKRKKIRQPAQIEANRQRSMPPPRTKHLIKSAIKTENNNHTSSIKCQFLSSCLHKISHVISRNVN